MIDIFELAKWVGALLSISIVYGIFYKFYKRVENLESWNSKQQCDIETGASENQMLLKGTLACLKGLHELGCNGAVTETIEELEKFTLEQAHKPKSKK